MSRFVRPPFDFAELQQLRGDEAKNRRLFDWWCDEDDRLRLIHQLRSQREPTWIPSRSPLQIDPAPPLNEPAPEGFRDILLLSDPEQVRYALTHPEVFGNAPYAALGGASFLLGQDPGPGFLAIDWHAEQKQFITCALGHYPKAQLRELAELSVAQAALTSLAAPEFDLALWAEQAALRFFGQLFGFGFQDHVLLEDASRATYRALQYVAIGQHFVTEPATLPAAQQALGRLVTRSSELMEDYTQLQRAPRRYGPPWLRNMPVGVQPWSELGLTALGEPLLKRAPGLTSKLSGRDRAIVLSTMLAGTLGNVQTAVCLLVQSLLAGRADEFRAVRDIRDGDVATLQCTLEQRLAQLPPVPVLPRRTRQPLDKWGQFIKTDTDCLLLLEGQPGCPHAHTANACPRIWGDVAAGAAEPATHPCLGRDVSMPLIAALVRHAIRLPALKPSRDPLTAEPLKVERLWGFAATRHPLQFERERVRSQNNLIVAMRVKSPISENAARLRRLIAGAVPRIEHVLTGFGSVHFAWFEFSDDDTQLVLRTIYDGPFDAYIEHFALRAGDLFDGLFEFLEEAPTRPVAEHPQEFVDTIRRHNRAPLAGYLYSAYPSTEAEQVRRCAEGRR